MQSRRILFVIALSTLALFSAWRGETADTLSAAQQTATARAEYKFNFGAGKVAPGYTQVLPGMTYNREIGYGFEPGAPIKGVDRGGRDALRGDFVTSDQPFFFSIAVPEGNYNVTVTLGDAQSGTNTTVKAELRRLMLESVHTAPGRFETRTFTVNVRTPRITDGGEVKLKDREKTTEAWAWDEKLTLEITGSRPAICALEISRADYVPTIFLLGDSTVCDQPAEPYNSWGQMLTRFFKPGIAVANHAESGESLRSSLAAGRLDKVLSVIKPGDHLFIQYGHNDQREKGEGVGALTTYKADLKRFVADARKRGAIPVLLTSMNRRNFNVQGKAYSTLGDYPEAVRQASKEDNVPLIDLNAMSKALYEALGPDRSELLFKSGDGTHHSNYGSYELAKCVVEGIRSNKLGLAKYLVTDVAHFDPSRPDAFEAFAVPASPQRADAGIADLQRLFQSPPDDSRIMMRWWWFGPAVAEAELEREMRLMKEGGIGGFEVQPVYPVVLDDPATGIKTKPFLSDDFIEALRFTSKKARELGLRFDLTIGSGWPYGGATVPIGQAAGRLRVERVNVPENTRRVPLPSIGAGEKLLAVFAARAEGKSIAADTLREITDIREGSVALPEGAAGPLQVQFYIASRTGMQVKRPAIGGEGFVLDHLDRASVDSYLNRVGDRLMRAFEAGPPHAVFCDSLEVYNSDWTGDFLEEFQKRRGYDLKPHLPALANDLGSKSASIRHDWGQTLTELLNERFLKPLHEWSQKNKTRLRIQCYGTPAAALSSNAHADLSEGEGHRWKSLSATRWASSANHLFGRPVTSSETWTWLHSPSFRATPLDVKAEADIHFLQGVNQLIGHGWPYTAPGVEYPGWRFYAAGVFNEKNPWWIVMPDLSKYLQRLSFMMRQGEPKNDVAIYLPNDDAWAHFTNGNANLIEVLRERLGPSLIPAVLESGNNFDFFDDEVLKQIGRVENGSLTLGANKYKAVILPNVEQIPTATLQRLVEFARTGGTLIATRRTPALSPGFQAKVSDHQQIAEVSKRLFEGPGAIGHLVTDETTQLAAALTAALKPDVVLSPVAPDIGFIHRAASGAEIYFVANTGNERRHVKATFRVDGLNPEWWDPMSGEARTAAVVARSANGVSVSLDLEPYGSRVLVFSRRALAPLASVTSEAPAPIDLSEGWQVSFGESGTPVRMNTLRSWTEDEKTRYYSGFATYEKTFGTPDGFLKKGMRVRLDFGEGQPVAPPAKPSASGMRAMLDGPVREAAVVTVNGRRAGSVWCPPYSIDVTDYLRNGENKLRIVVANTAINYMAGHALPDYRLLNLRYGERFQPQDMDKVAPVPSGLLGRVRLISRVVE